MTILAGKHNEANCISTFPKETDAQKESPEWFTFCEWRMSEATGTAQGLIQDHGVNQWGRHVSKLGILTAHPKATLSPCWPSHWKHGNVKWSDQWNDHITEAISAGNEDKPLFSLDYASCHWEYFLRLLYINLMNFFASTMAFLKGLLLQ